MQTIPVFCGKDCGGNACPLLATVQDGKVLKVTNNPAGGPLLTGCQRGFNLPGEMYAPDRLLRPLIRTGPRGSGQYREAEWDEALDLVATRFREIRAAHGPQAILNLGSAGQTSALHNTADLLSRFLHLAGGCTSLTSNYSNGAARFSLPYLFGEDWKRSGFDAATMRHSRMIILWGANVLEARLGSELDRCLLAAKERGTPIVVIDPRRSLSARRLDARWLPIRPGTDNALMFAILHVLLSEGLARRDIIETYSVGFEQLADHVLGRDGSPAKTPVWAAARCGLDAATITGFARDYAAARPAMLLPGFSIQRVHAGEDSYRLSVALQLVTGNIGIPGGSSGSMNNRLPAPRVGTLPVPANPVSAAVPVVRWPDLILQGMAGAYPADIHAAYVVGSNFVNQGADVHKAIAAFERLDFAVCHDLFMTPTARLCDVILPAAHSLEKSDIGIPWSGNFLTWKPRAVPPAGQCRTDYDIFSALAARLGFGPAFTEGRSESDWLRHFLDGSAITDIPAFKDAGIWFGPERERTGLADFIADPQRFPLATPSGRIEIASLDYQRDTGFPPIPVWQERPADQRFPLDLITPKSLFRTHSQGSNIAAVQARAAHSLAMNPADAACRGIADGQSVRCWNERGALHVAVRLDNDLMPGVVCLPEGVWFELDAHGEDRAGSANLLTATDGTRPARANIMHGVAVEVEVQRPAI